jgi:hypothetical protein
MCAPGWDDLEAARKLQAAVCRRFTKCIDEVKARTNNSRLKTPAGVGAVQRDVRFKGTDGSITHASRPWSTRSDGKTSTHSRTSRGTT